MIRFSPSSQRGSSLVSVLILMLVAVTVLVAMASVTAAALLSLSGWRQSTDAIFAAESGADDFLYRVLRNPSVTPVGGTEMASYPNASSYIFLTPGAGNAPNTLITKGIAGNYIRIIKVQYTVDGDGRVTIITRQETQ